ncbi:3-isopropylmalate dehydratase small subunit [Kordiimonas lacus]|uniref:3-isopropylmalate dehydratase small subunit n=1 Tax=Kordiimonas lacus TaxID=637679 RepID=A0A1G6ZQT5_9PROT|nr:3-isopropylmalate dehydratase small subunit [Kordiimonas lacus]SDE04587.1 3-isopropylmalate/(R)-2-methylmalate dehydratase small subunit [Kordiimonas lacus]
MEKFVSVTSIATPFPRVNVDTDIIIPAKHLKSIKRTGFGEHAFETVRYNADGSRIENNVFDGPKYKGAKILIAGDNFGCGSSREHAPWAIAELGYRCIIAPSFADIFAGNCVKNGILTVALSQDEVDALVLAAEAGHEIHVNLNDQTVTCQNAKYEFDFNPAHKEMLLNGLDEIGQTLQAASVIKGYEDKQKLMTPWLFRG